MKFKSQEHSLNQLELLSNYDRHSILIEGPEGCGKSYLACEYQKLLGIDDFQQINPNVQSIREAIDMCIQIKNKIVLCIENLDTGVPAASYTLLKFLEEPTSNVYVVVTCRNIDKVPDTIVSRSTVVSLSTPLDCDIEEFSKVRYLDKYNSVKDLPIWRCVRTFKDAETVLMMSDAELNYFKNLSQSLSFKDTVYNMMWKFGHYDDNSDTPIELVIRYIMDITNSTFVKQCGIECIKDITQGRIASHAALAKFCFDVKYCE